MIMLQQQHADRYMVEDTEVLAGKIDFVHV
jgi:hypothetical protein